MPEFSSTFWFFRLSLGSFLRAFHLPDAAISTEVFVYLQCSGKRAREATNLEGVNVSSSWTEYVQGVVSNVYEITKGAFAVQYFCTSSLAQAQCHTARVGGAKYVFLLEHDWFFPRTRIRHSISNLITLMKLSNISYIRFNKRRNVATSWDGPCLINHTFSGELYLSFSGTYNNNPHIANFLTYEKWFDKKQCESSTSWSGAKWEREMRQICKPNKVLHGSCSHFVRLSSSLCRNFIYGYEGYPSTAYHLDGSRRKNESLRDLFQDIPQFLRSYQRKDISLDLFSDMIERAKQCQERAESKLDCTAVGQTS